MMAIIVMRGTARENEVKKKAMARALAPKSKPPFPLAELDGLPSAAAASAARVTTDPRRVVVRLASSAMDAQRNDASAVDAFPHRVIAARGATRPPLMIRWLDNDVVVSIVRPLATRVVVVVVVVVVVDPPRTRIVNGVIIVAIIVFRVVVVCRRRRRRVALPMGVYQRVLLCIWYCTGYFIVFT
jgi:hypothetical protein